MDEPTKAQLQEELDKANRLTAELRHELAFTERQRANTAPLAHAWYQLAPEAQALSECVAALNALRSAPSTRVAKGQTFHDPGNPVERVLLHLGARFGIDLQVAKDLPMQLLERATDGAGYAVSDSVARCGCCGR